MNYQNLTNTIKNQLNPDNISLEKSFLNELSSISYSDVLTFVRVSMKAVDDNYTRITKEAGDNAKQHLDRDLVNKTFRYQGSVMTNTHIRGHSDIDLLVITDKFYSYDLNSINQILENVNVKSSYRNESITRLENQKSGSSYSGNSLEDLGKLRSDSESTLSRIYSVCEINKPKSIRITNLNLRRDVDVVIANWYDDVKSVINDKNDYRGVQVYNKLLHSQGKIDYPFLSIKRVNERSSYTNGRLKKMIRFLKNVKAHSGHNLSLSSFDFNAITYDIATSDYMSKTYYELVKVVYDQLKSICNNSNHSDKLTSVDDREYIFRYNPEKLEELRIILNEVESIKNDLDKTYIYG